MQSQTARSRRTADVPLVRARFLFPFCLALLLSPSTAGNAAAHVRRNVTRPRHDGGQRFRLSLDEAWRFAGAEVEGAEGVAFDDSRWAAVNLPHTWNVADTQDDEPGYRRGVGWYRKRLSLPAGLEGKRLFLYFEGANQTAEVFVNGRSVGRHRGGYTAFAFDITDALSRAAGAQNIVAVKVDNSPDKDIPPLSADFDFYGGIYRNVWLVATDPVHINLLDHASQGVYVDTPEVNASSATVRVRGTLASGEAEVKQVRVVSTVFDPAGKSVAVMTTALAVDAGREASFEQSSRAITRPRLWSPDHPALYTVSVRIYVGARQVDGVESPLGFRWFSVDAGRGFFLNGEPLKLRGVNRHQDYQGLGNAVPDRLHVRDMEITKAMGANFVRLAHYPQAPSVIAAADRLGLILWEEIPIVNYITTSDSFTQNCEEMLTEMIRQHYNHPSILMWGYMNEILLRPQKEEGYTGKVVELARRLDQLAHHEDATRLTVMAVHHSEIYNTSGLADVPQAVGWNLYLGWYEGNFADFGPFLDEQHRRFPRRPVFVSEYGADADRRLHSLNPQRLDYTIEWQRLLHESYLEQIEARPFLAGTTLWNEFDFGAEQRGNSKPHMNQKGLLTFDRQPKDIYFFYQARLTKRPVIHIATRDWLRRIGAGSPGTVGTPDTPQALQPVEVFTNLPVVELFVNGLSLGSRAVGPSCHATWQVPFREGFNVVEARGLSGARMLGDRIEVQFAYRAPVLKDPRAPFKRLAVDVGSNAQYLDDAGIIWEADQEYTPGGWGYVGGKAIKTERNIPRTTDDHLYQFSREGMEGYRFDVPDGDYRVELLFAEPEYEAPGKRVFDVLLNGRTVIERLDLVKHSGAGRPALLSFHTCAAGGEGIKIEFRAAVGPPLVSAILVIRE